MTASPAGVSPGRAKPFLKWAGGKRQLLPRLRTCYPATFTAYHEPFLGSGAVFFDLWNAGRLRGQAATLTDQNADLIGCYLRVRDDGPAVIGELSRLAAGHAEGGRDHFYDVRDARFNPAREQWRAAGGRAESYPAALAAMLIYLNRTGFNGLFRLNASGGFNVPMGRYARPRILDATLLETVAAILRQPRIGLAHEPFDGVVARAARGDFVYFDPPYAPVSDTARFRSYTAAGFGDADQQRLAQVAVTLAERGVWVLLSNSVAPLVVDLYSSPAARRAGLTAKRVPARRAINAAADRRGVVDELLVTNVAPEGAV